jgi:hypothetical protein
MAYDRGTGISATTSPSDIAKVLEIKDEIEAVAAIDDEVVAVAGNSADIAIVAADLTGPNTIGTVAGDIVNVQNVSNNIAAVIAVDSNETNINTVAADITDVTTVATNIADVTAVATDIANVNTVATNIADVTTVATDITDVSTVAGIASDVTTVAGIAADVTTVAGDSVNIGIVATDIANVNTVATNIADVTTVAADIADVSTVATNIVDVTTVAGISTDVSTVASISTDVTSVAGIAADVTSVAEIDTDVSTVAGISTDVSTVAASVTGVGILADIADLDYTGNANKVIAVNATADDVVFAAVGTGTVTSVDMTVPTGLEVSGNPITTAGTLAVTYATGYSIPTTTSQSNWDTAYGWGDHAAAGYLDSGDINTTVQAYDADTAKTDVANTFTAIQTFDQPIIVTDIVYPVASFSWNSATASPAADFLATPGRLINAHRNMRRCVINDSGVVQYYLDPLDSTKKADGTSSVLTGADGMVMVEVPKFYVRRVTAGTITTWFVSDYPLSGYVVHPAFVKDGVEVNNRYYSAYDACAFDVSTSTYISGLNRDNAVSNTPNVDVTASTGDKLASVSGIYPMVGLTRAQFRTIAANRGSGWLQLDWTLFSAVQVLYLTEYQTFNSQAVLGDGNTNGTYVTQSDNQNQSPNSPAGLTNSIGNASTNGSQASAGASPGTAFMSYRGIENFYGNVWNWTDGINVNVTANGNVHVTNNRADFADNTSTNMTLVSTTAPTTSGFVSAIAAIDYYFVASSVSGGSSSTYLTDQWFGSTSSNRVVRVSGSSDNGANAGAFFVSANTDSSFASRFVGGRLAF